MKRINPNESWHRSIPDGMFVSTYRTYKADLEFLCEQEPCQKPRPNSKRSECVEARVVKTKDAAAYLGISDWKLRNLVQSGEIRYIAGDGTSPWLFDKQDLDHWIETRKQSL